MPESRLVSLAAALVVALALVACGEDAPPPAPAPAPPPPPPPRVETPEETAMRAFVVSTYESALALLDADRSVLPADRVAAFEAARALPVVIYGISPSWITVDGPTIGPTGLQLDIGFFREGIGFGYRNARFWEPLASADPERVAPLPLELAPVLAAWDPTVRPMVASRTLPPLLSTDAPAGLSVEMRVDHTATTERLAEQSQLVDTYFSPRSRDVLANRFYVSSFNEAGEITLSVELGPEGLELLDAYVFPARP